MNDMRFPCPCCGCLTLDSPGRFEICQVCFWEDDPLQRDRPGMTGGSNPVSLVRARETYRWIGHCEPAMMAHNRAPTVVKLRQKA